MELPQSQVMVHWRYLWNSGYQLSTGGNTWYCRILKTPIVKDDKIIVGNILSLSLTVDHRMVDGGGRLPGL